MVCVVHDAIAYAPYESQFFNQAYTAYEFHPPKLVITVVQRIIINVRRVNNLTIFKVITAMWDITKAISDI